jgi:hypothetical protein
LVFGHLSQTLEEEAESGNGILQPFTRTRRAGSPLRSLSKRLRKVQQPFIPMLRICSLLLLIMVPFAPALHARPEGWEIREGKFMRNGEWIFLKIGKPLRNFADPRDVDRLIADLDTLQAKHYTALELNCYWHHFDKTGDGIPDVSLEPLRRLIDAISDRGMIPCLSVETYGVGGGFLPGAFWEKHPDALAVNAQGREVSDDEYGTGAKVPSLYSPAYIEASRNFIRHLTAGLNHEKILWFETTVEPQYMGNQDLCYSVHARRAYEEWLRRNDLAGIPFPVTFPIPQTFVTDPLWNRFRAEYLADWVNGDAAVFREVAGADAYIAVDYLETCGEEMRRRLGDPITFLTRLTSADVLQVNWHWHVANDEPNHCAYENVRKVMAATGRSWAISEHMTLNASDYSPARVPQMLRNTLAQGNRLGWEFVSVSPITASDFSLYHDDWSPKPLMAVVEDRWQEWMALVREFDRDREK